MGVARMLRHWRKVLQTALPGLHGHQINGLAEASWAMIQAADCRLSKMAVATPGSAALPSRERRWQRLVANDRLRIDSTLNQWARWALADAGQVTLLLDETPQHNHLRAMKISRMSGGRATPLLWHAYRPDAPPMPQDQLVLDLLERADQALPHDAKPTLMADRGLCWPAIIDFCVEHGWHFVLRGQRQTAVKFDDGKPCALGELVHAPGDRRCGRAWVFKTAGWRRANVVACWEVDCDEPWLLITDRPANRRRCREYRKRMRQEQSFRDEKSHGFEWNRSAVRDPDHASRLLIVMALAMTWLIRLGRRIIQRGQRGRYERPDRRTLSHFQLALRYLHDQLQPVRDPPPPKSVGR